MIKLGTGNVTLCLGDKKVKAAWLGSEKVYPNSFLELSASSLSFAAAGQTQQLAITVNDGQAWTIAALPAGFSVSASSGTGPATVTVTAANNTSTTARTGALTVNSEDLSAACSLSQTAGAKVFEAPVITDFHYTGTGVTYDPSGSYAPAAGGNFTSFLSYYQDYTWNGAAGSGERLTTGAAVSCSGTGVASNGNLTMPSKGTSFSAQTLFTEVTVTISMNGKSYTGHHKVYQAANYVVKIEGIGSRNTLSYSQAPAGGGTSSPTWTGDTDAVMDTKVRTTFSSGATAGWSAAKAGGTWSIDRMPYSWSGASGNFTALNASTGAVTVSSKGTTFSAATSGPAVTCNIYYKFTHNAAFGGSAVVAVSAVPGTATPTQAANYVTAVAIKASTFSYGTIGAEGGTMNPTVPGNGTLTYTFSSGSSTTTTPTAGGTETRVVTFSMSAGNGFTGINASSGAVSASSKGTTINGVTTSNTITRTLVATFKNNAAYGGTSVTGTGSSTTTCSQAANAVTGYGTPTGRTLSVADIPASGGSVSSGTLGGTITQSRTFTSGASDTLTNPTVSASSYSAAVSGANLGTTVTSRTAKGTLTYYYTCNGKQGSCSATVYQAANTWYDHDIVLSADSTSIGAAGGSVTLTATVYRMYASGTRAVGGSGYGTLSGSATGFTVSGWTVTAAGRGTTVGAARSIAVVCKYNGLTSNSVTVTQAANAAKAESTYILVNGSQATSKSLSFGNTASTQYLRLRQKQNYSYTSGATGVVDTSQKPSFTSSSGYFTVSDATDYGGNTTVPEYMFGITVTANSSSSSRSATVTFTFPNGDKVTASCTQSAGGGTTTKPQYLKIMADSVTVGNSSVPSLTVAWGTAAGSYPNSETLTASNITTTGKTVSLGNMASGRTIYFKFSGQVTPVKMASIEFTGSGGLTLSGDTSYLGASTVEFYGQMSVDTTSKTANLNITTVQ